MNKYNALFIDEYAGLTNLDKVLDDSFLSETLTSLIDVEKYLQENSVDIVIVNYIVCMKNNMKEIKSLIEKNKTIPFVFIATTPLNEQEIMDGYELGCVDFLLHSLLPNNLVIKLKSLINYFSHPKVLEKIEKSIKTKTKNMLRLNSNMQKGLNEMDELEKEFEATMEQTAALSFKAELANSAQEAFLLKMSHEILDPIDVILENAEILKKDNDNLDFIESVDIITRSGSALKEIIADVFNISKVEAGEIELAKTEFEFIKTIHDVMVLIKGKLESNDVKLVLDLDSELPEILIGDGIRIRQILMNLIGNAIKFTSKGSIILTVKQEFVEENKIQIYFSVKDTGIGIDIDKLDKIFESFSQEEDSTAREFGGTGLGLSISKQLIELMGGEIKVNSEKDTGSNFYFSCQFNLV